MVWRLTARASRRAAGSGTRRVYIMGTSSGAVLTQALVAVYAEVFQAGAAYSGVTAAEPRTT